jgi:hypothetical protein
MVAVVCFFAIYAASRLKGALTRRRDDGGESGSREVDRPVATGAGGALDNVATDWIRSAIRAS